MKLRYKEIDFELTVHYRPEDGRYCVEVETFDPANPTDSYGGMGRDFNSAFMDLLENLQVHYTP